MCTTFLQMGSEIFWSLTFLICVKIIEIPSLTVMLCTSVMVMFLGAFFMYFFQIWTRMHTEILVLPLSFIFHNLCLVVNSSKVFHLFKKAFDADLICPLSQLQLSEIQKTPLCSPLSGLWAASRTRGWRLDRNRGVVPGRVSTMGDQNEDSG